MRAGRDRKGSDGIGGGGSGGGTGEETRKFSVNVECVEHEACSTSSIRAPCLKRISL
jgi:hypothetical protein